MVSIFLESAQVNGAGGVTRNIFPVPGPHRMLGADADSQQVTLSVVWRSALSLVPHRSR